MPTFGFEVEVEVISLALELKVLIRTARVVSLGHNYYVVESRICLI